MSSSAANCLDVVVVMEALVIEPYHDKQAPELMAGDTGAEFLILPTSVGGVKGTERDPDPIASVTRQLAEAFR